MNKIDDFLFDKTNTFCINLDYSTERWERMQKRFSYFGIDVTRWSGLTKPEYQEDKYVDYLTPSQIGCAASHVSIWRHMIKNDINYALIMEDDACFDKKWREKLSGITDKTFDSILLYSSEHTNPLYKWKKCREHVGTVSYIISKSGAIKILNMYCTLF